MQLQSIIHCARYLPPNIIPIWQKIQSNNRGINASLLWYIDSGRLLLKTSLSVLPFIYFFPPGRDCGRCQRVGSLLGRVGQNRPGVRARGVAHGPVLPHHQRLHGISLRSSAPVRKNINEKSCQMFAILLFLPPGADREGLDLFRPQVCGQVRGGRGQRRLVFFMAVAFWFAQLQHSCYLNPGAISWMETQRRCRPFSPSSWNVCGSWRNNSRRWDRSATALRHRRRHWRAIKTPLPPLPRPDRALFPSGVWVQRVVLAADPRARALLPVRELPGQQPEAAGGAAVSLGREKFPCPCPPNDNWTISSKGRTT